MDSRVQYILSQCAQRMYILKLLRSQGMPNVQLSMLHTLLLFLVSCMLFLLGEVLSSEHNYKVNAFLNELNPMDT